MNIIFMGTPEYSVPTLNALVKAGHTIECVVAQPDKPKGRGKQMMSPATIIRARELGIPTKQPRAVRRGPFVEWMKTSEADVAVVIAYGRILIPELLSAPRLGCINAHASLLPAYRGAAPIHWAIINGESETGVCIMQMDEGMDTGDVLLQESLPIHPTDTTPILWDKLAQLSAKLTVEALEKLEHLVPVPQNHSHASYAPLLEKSLGQMDWTWSAERLHNLVRGVQPWPGAFTHLRGKLLKIWETEPCEGQGIPGTVLEASINPIIATGSGALKLINIQRPGKKRMSASSLIHGQKLSVGERLGNQE